MSSEQKSLQGFWDNEGRRVVTDPGHKQFAEVVERSHGRFYWTVVMVWQIPSASSLLPYYDNRIYYCFNTLCLSWGCFLVCWITWERSVAKVTAHFHGNYLESPRQHQHCWQLGQRKDTAPKYTKLHTILAQCMEDHVSRQLYNKDHLPLGWLSGGFSSRW